MTKLDFILRRARCLARQAVASHKCHRTAVAWLERAAAWCVKYGFPAEAAYVESLRREVLLDILYPEV